MNQKPFAPNLPETMIKAEISAREADLLIKLRKYPFGQFTIHKRFDRIDRVDISDSQKINEKNGLTLAIEG